MTDVSNYANRAKVNQAFALARSLVFYVGYAILMALSGLAVILMVPVFGFRKRYYVLSQFGIVIIYWGRLICGMRFKLEGADNVPDQACVVVSNHESAWETLFLGALFRPQATVLKKELLHIPLFGWGLRFVRPIALDRKRPSGALKTLLREGTVAVRGGCWVVIYPEGTRIRPDKTGRFNKGGAMLAIRSGVPVVPVAHTAGRCWPAGRVLKYPGLIRVRVGKPIPTAGRSVDEVHTELEQWIRSTMVQLRTGQPEHD